jgi:hypothetical protein
MTEVITCSISRELREKIDLLRGDISRSKFMTRILSQVLDTNMRNSQLWQNLKIQ